MALHKCNKGGDLARASREGRLISGYWRSEVEGVITRHSEIVSDQ
jgi:hypothetical protein